jgi:AcrR family transcriptional regulator
MMQEVIGTREATKRETRRALLEAALAEFAQRGFDAPSLDSICARAGYTRGAFYVHFSSRDELVTAAMEHVIESFVEGFMPTGQAGDDVATTIELFADTVVPELIRARAESGSSAGVRLGAIDAPPFHKFLEACARSEAVREGMVHAVTRVIERLQKAGEAAQGHRRMRDDVGAQEVAELLLLMALGVFSASEMRLNLDIPALRDALKRLLVGG